MDGHIGGPSTSESGQSDAGARSSWVRIGGDPIAWLGIGKPNLVEPSGSGAGPADSTPKACSIGMGKPADLGDRGPSMPWLAIFTGGGGRGMWDGPCRDTCEPSKSSTACKNSVALSVSVRRGRRRPGAPLGKRPGGDVRASASQGWGPGDDTVGCTDQEPVRCSERGAGAGRGGTALGRSTGCSKDEAAPRELGWR